MKGERTTSKSKQMADLPGFLASDTAASLARKEKIIRRLKERELLSSVSAGQSITITPAYILPQREATESSFANWTSGLVEASSTQSLDIICARSEPICNNQRQRLFSVQVEEILSENFPFERFCIKKKPHSIPRTLYH
ncbi:unnamed protein product [Hymenolepis diminuta]|uniref:Uncharacterized protein n=1 Tax=Hymenolepis diminuta TaxID=6216 RepID=A0A564YIS1_HYMDI|nr:unnamed protein product [Hymenolepis diminuta]